MIHAWTLLTLPLLFLALSMTGIVLGWASWDQSRSGGGFLSDAQDVHIVELLLAFFTAALVTFGVRAFSGMSNPVFAIGCGIVAAILIWMTARFDLG